MSSDLGNYYIEIDADVVPFLKGMDKVQSALDALSADSKSGSKAFENLSSSASGTGSSFSELAGYARSMDGSLKTLNSNVNAITRAMQEAGTGASGAGSEFRRTVLAAPLFLPHRFERVPRLPMRKSKRLAS